MVKFAQLRDRGEAVGRLDQESMLELLGELAKSRLPMYLWIKCMAEEGHYYFREGKMVAAACRSLRGKQAAYNCLAFRSGIFRMVKNRKPPAENVEIDWAEFERIFHDELKKLVVPFIHGLDGKFVFRLEDSRQQEVYSYEDANTSALSKLMARTLESGRENGFKVLVRGLEEYLSESKDNAFACVFYIPELRYLVSAGGEAREKELILNWLRYEFIPFARDAVSTALKKADKLARRAGILAVLPDPKLAEQVSSPLNAAGFKVWLCRDGFEGLVRVEEFRPDLIILYSRLDRISAGEVYQRLKRKEESQMIPVVCLLEEGDRENFSSEPGGDVYLEIPFSAKKLAKEVENILEIK